MCPICFVQTLHFVFCISFLLQSSWFILLATPPVGMLDLDAPCNALELHVLAKRLDRDKSESIDYVEFSKGLNFTDE